MTGSNRMVVISWTALFVALVVGTVAGNNDEPWQNLQPGLELARFEVEEAVVEVFVAGGQTPEEVFRLGQTHSTKGQNQPFEDGRRRSLFTENPLRHRPKFPIVWEQRNDDIGQGFEAFREFGVGIEDEKVAAGPANLHRRISQPSQHFSIVPETLKILEQIEASRCALGRNPGQCLHRICEGVSAGMTETVDAIPDGDREGFRFGTGGKAFQEPLHSLLFQADQQGQGIGGRERVTNLIK